MAKLGLMIDIETLATAPDAVVTEIALVPFDPFDEERFDDHIGEFREYLPIDPQFAAGRVASASTLAWWMGPKVTDIARIKMAERLEGNSKQLSNRLERAAYTIQSWRDSVGKGEFEIWARGPQFDITILESLLSQVGIRTPYKYNEVRDLRTLCAVADLDLNTVIAPADFVAHSALSDCRYQIACYYAAQNRLANNAKAANPMIIIDPEIGIVGT